MSNKVKLSIVGLVIFLAGYIFASPYLALNAIKSAAQNGDSDKLSSYIDYPSVRQSLKDTLNAQMLKNSQEEESNEFGALGAMFASAMVDKMVDAYVTPKGMQMIIKGKDVKESIKPSPETKSETSEEADYTMGYDSFNQFGVEIGKAQDKDGVKLILHRDGLSWKITQIDLPKKS